MKCSLEGLKEKEVIDIENGEKLGYVDDIELNMNTYEVQSLIIYGRERFFGFFGREEDILIPCKNIKVIGKDVLLIMRENDKTSYVTKTKRKFFESLLNN